MSKGLLFKLLLTAGTLWYTVSSFSAGYSVATPSPDGKQVLWRTAFTGDTSEIRHLTVHRRDINEPDPAGWTPLLLAAGMGHTSAVQALLEKGADVDVQCDRGRTALMQAAMMGYGDVVQLLLAAGADVSLKDADGNTALHHAACADGRYDPPADPTLWAKVGPGNTHLIERPRGQYASIAADLLAHGADAGHRNNLGKTALDMAVEHQNAPVSEVLRAHVTLE